MTEVKQKRKNEEQQSRKIPILNVFGLLFLISTALLTLSLVSGYEELTEIPELMLYPYAVAVRWWHLVALIVAAYFWMSGLRQPLFSYQLRGCAQMLRHASYLIVLAIQIIPLVSAFQFQISIVDSERFEGKVYHLLQRDKIADGYPFTSYALYKCDALSVACKRTEIIHRYVGQDFDVVLVETLEGEPYIERVSE